MTPNDWKHLQKLCSIHAVSGREDRLIRHLREWLQPRVDDLRVDNLGNLVAILRGSQHPEHKLMLQAHIDELGLIVRNLTQEGFLLIERVGGVPEKSLLGQRMDVLTESGAIIPAYVGTKSHHITQRDEKFVVPQVHEMYLDLGVTSRDAVENLGIQVGDPVTYHPNYHTFGDGLICSKALDNRVSVFVLLEVLKRLQAQRPPSTIILAFTVLEEFSIRGSLPAVTSTKPDAILSLDITVAPDTPESDPLHPVVMRGGPAIKMMDFHGRGTLGGMFSSPKLRDYLIQRAGEKNLSLQREVIVGVITDPAFQLYLGEQGQVIAGISIPQRYTHAPISMCHQQDIRDTIDLVEAAARGFTPQLDLSRG